MDVPDAVAASELGGVAHGPLLLAATDGIVVGLRCVYAHRTGLHVPVVLVAHGVHADAAQRRSGMHGEDLRLVLGPAGQEVPARLIVFATQSAGSEDEYRQESSYWHAGLPSSEHLTVTVAWPEIGLNPTTTDLRLPDLAGVADAAVSLG